MKEVLEIKVGERETDPGSGPEDPFEGQKDFDKTTHQYLKSR